MMSHESKRRDVYFLKKRKKKNFVLNGSLLQLSISLSLLFSFSSSSSSLFQFVNAQLILTPSQTPWYDTVLPNSSICYDIPVSINTDGGTSLFHINFLLSPVSSTPEKNPLQLYVRQDFPPTKDIYDFVETKGILIEVITETAGPDLSLWIACIYSASATPVTYFYQTTTSKFGNLLFLRAFLLFYRVFSLFFL
jgi:hypothetical protein